MKTIFLIAIITLLTCCKVRIEPRKASATQVIHCGGYRYVEFHKYKTEGMEFGVFYTTTESSQSGNGVCVVNLTKDKLEIEKLKLEIEKFKTEQNTLQAKAK